MRQSFFRLTVLAFGLLIVVTVATSPARAAGVSAQAGGAAGGINNWYTLAPGQSAEWLFHYPGGGDSSLIAFGVDPANSISVNVYDDGQWRNLGAGVWPVEPVGRGTPGTLGDWSSNKDLIDNGSLFWEAVAAPAVLFHIQVSNTTQAPARYWIAQAGAGAGGLAPYAAVAAPSPAPQPTVNVPAPAGRLQASHAPPPKALPVAGSEAAVLLWGAGLALLAAGWLGGRSRA